MSYCIPLSYSVYFILSFLANGAVGVVLDLALKVGLVVGDRVVLRQGISVDTKILFVAQPTTRLVLQVDDIVRVVVFLLLLRVLLGLVFGCAVSFLGGGFGRGGLVPGAGTAPGLEGVHAGPTGRHARLRLFLETKNK